jgi:signal transduction histidine kinase
MTHEIRTPLNAIVGFSDLLHMASTTEERTEFIHIIRHNCDLLLRLIDDLLETSDMNENAQRIEPENIDFALFFNEMGQTLEQRVQEPSVKFLMDNPYSTFPVRTDKERIQQVITNFVTNAVKYTHEGHIRIGYIATSEVSGDTPTIPSITEKVEIAESLSSDNGILIYCEDTGAGIPPEKQSSVFDRFVKLDDYVQGTGLGLSICKSIAERCNGRIGLISEGKGKGSTFWLWIPRYLTLGNLTIEK